MVVCVCVCGGGGCCLMALRVILSAYLGKAAAAARAALPIPTNVCVFSVCLNTSLHEVFFFVGLFCFVFLMQF